MGSFYSTCSISHMTLRGEKTSIQLLVPTYNKDFSDCLGMIVSNDGCQAFFAPFGFPIHGVYDDYGQIHSIERDKNVEILEDFFNLGIEEIMSNVGDDRWHKYGEKEENGGGMDWKVKGKDGTSIRNQEIFLGMGMTYFRTEILEFLQKGWEEEISGDGSYFKMILDGIDKEAARPKSRRGEMLLELKEAYNSGKFNADEEQKAKIEKAIKEIDMDVKDVEDKEDKFEYSCYAARTYIASLVHTHMFEALPITSKDFKEEIAKQYTFLRMFGGWGLGRTLMPSDYGSQETNWQLLAEMNTFTNKLLKKNNEDEIAWEIEGYVDEKTGEFNLKDFRADYGYNVVTDTKLKSIAKKVHKEYLKTK